MYTQKFIKIFHSVQEIGLFSLFQNLNLGNASANPKWHLTISWATSCQYQCACKILHSIPNDLRVVDIFHEQSGDKIFTNCPVTKSNVCYRALYDIQLQASVDFLRVVQKQNVWVCHLWGNPCNLWQISVTDCLAPGEGTEGRQSQNFIKGPWNGDVGDDGGYDPSEARQEKPCFRVFMIRKDWNQLAQL